MNSISPQLQNQIAQYQQVQQQLQAVSTQRSQMDAQKREMERTLAELKASTGDVYRSAGSLLIKVEDKAKLEGDMEESIETMGVRLSGIERQEKSLQERFQALADSINAAMGNAQARQAPRQQPAPKADDEEEEDD